MLNYLQSYFFLNNVKWEEIVMGVFNTRRCVLFGFLLLVVSCYGRNNFNFFSESMLCRGSLLGYDMKDASLAGFHSIFLHVSVQRKFMVKELNEKSLMAGFPAGRGAFALSFKEYGLTTYHERTAAIHYARGLGPGFACGLRMIWHRNAFGDEHYIDTDTYSFAISILSKAGKKNLIDLQIANPVFYPSSEFPVSGLQPALSAGMEWFLSSSASVKAEFKQRRGMKTFSGISMKIIQKNRFLIAAGMGINPGTCHFCCAWRVSGIIVSIRADWQPELGFSPESALFAEYERSK